MMRREFEHLLQIFLASVSSMLVVFSMGTSALMAGDRIGPENADFEEADATGKPDGWGRPAGYLVTLSEENPVQGKRCVTIQRDLDQRPGFGNIMQRFEAEPYRGKRVRYRAAVRVEPTREKARSQMWLRVDMKSNGPQPEMGFFDNMSDRPITSNKWQYYEIVGEVADDAQWVNIGMFLKGDGQAWMDDLSFEIVDASAPLTGRPNRTAPTIARRSQLGPGLFEVVAAKEVRFAPGLTQRLKKMLRDASAEQAAADEAGPGVELLLPLPLAYRDQVPLSRAIAPYWVIWDNLTTANRRFDLQLITG